MKGKYCRLLPLFLYTPWVIGQFYDKIKIFNYIKAVFAYLFGMITFMIKCDGNQNDYGLNITTLKKMKNKIGFNLVFAILAFPIGLALLKEFDFNTFTFKKTALGILYLVTFILCVFLTFKKKSQQPEK